MMKCKFSYIEQGEPVTLEELGKVDGCANEDHNSYLETCIASILKVKEGVHIMIVATDMHWHVFNRLTTTFFELYNFKDN